MFDRIRRSQVGYRDQNRQLPDDQIYDLAKLVEVNRARVEMQTNNGITKGVERVIEIATIIKKRIETK
jgi:hypothetical protein